MTKIPGSRASKQILAHKYTSMLLNPANINRVILTPHQKG